MNCARCGSPASTPSCIECPAVSGHPAVALPSTLDDSAGPLSIGGWLILAAIGLVVSAITIAVQTLGELLPALSGPTWEALTTPGSEAYRPGFAAALVLSVVLSGLMLAYTLVTCVAFFQRRSYVPRMMIAFWLAQLALLVFDQVVVQGAQGEATPGIGPIAFAIEVARTLAWCAYYQRSVRVKRTFVR